MNCGNVFRPDLVANGSPVCYIIAIHARRARQKRSSFRSKDSSAIDDRKPGTAGDRPQISQHKSDLRSIVTPTGMRESYLPTSRLGMTSEFGKLLDSRSSHSRMRVKTMSRDRAVSPVQSDRAADTRKETAMLARSRGSHFVYTRLRFIGPSGVPERLVHSREGIAANPTSAI